MYKKISMNIESQETLTIVIPAYNEEKRIGPTIESIIDNIQELKEIIVVSDGKDETPLIARSFGDKVKVLEFPKRMGKGGAIIRGLEVADSEIVGFTDADGSAPWFEIYRLSKMVDNENQCVIGSRWTSDSKVLKPQSILRIILGRVYRYLAFAFLRIKVKDLQCGLKFFKKELLVQLIPKIRIKDWAFDTSLLYNVNLLGYEIKEVGIIWSNKEETKLRILRAIPLMFAYVIGLRIAHSRYSTKLQPLFHKISRAFEPS